MSSIKILMFALSCIVDVNDKYYNSGIQTFLEGFDFIIQAFFTFAK